MTEAQLGLLLVASIIVVFALMLRKMGALSTVATISAIILSVVIATYLFVTQVRP